MSILYTCQIIAHRAINVPISDLNNLSSDPYFNVALSAVTDTEQHSSSHPGPQTLTYRTQTARRTRDPTFNSKWIVSGIPAQGFTLTLKLIDEDPGNYDDKLGIAVLRFPFAGQILEDGWESGENEYKIHKRRGSVKSKVATFAARAVTRGRVGHKCRVWVSVKVLEKVDDQKDGRLYTLGPHRFVQHFSPIIGSFLGSTKAPNEDQSSLKASTFVANRLQLAGPVPASLRHRYVGFAPFVKAMFKKKGIEGILLHRALHRQHSMIYKWDKSTVSGVVGEDTQEDEENGCSGKEKDRDATSQSDAFARQLLQMTSHGTHGRIFTYVIMLDGEWRFTETSEEFAIQFLSKHTLHSDVCVEIAFSGEFFLRPFRHQSTSASGNSNDGHEHRSEEEEESPPSDPSQYELVIDNDSGTYRPRKDLLPTLQAYLASPANLAALGKITAMDGFDDKLKRWKEERAKVKAASARGPGKGILKGKFIQAVVSQSSSFSSGGSVSASSLGSAGGRDLGRKGNVGSGEVEAVLKEDAKRAKENEDQDQGAKEEARVEAKG